MCALAPTFAALVVGRTFQGIGAGFTIPSAQAHVLCFADPAKRARALGFWAAAGSVGFIAGLVLGGLLTALLSWRCIFWVSLALSALVVPAALLVLPRPDPRGARAPPPPPVVGRRGEAPPVAPPPRAGARLLGSLGARLERFDAVGVCLGVPGLLLLTYALTSANMAGWGAPSIVAGLVVSVALLGLFALHESRASQALVNPRLFHDGSFSVTLGLAVATYAVRQACSYFLTLQLQSHGNSPLRTAVLFLPVGLAALVANSVAGRLVPVLGARLMFVLGWALCIAGVVLFSFVAPDANYWRFAFPGMVLYIAGLGVVYITANFVVSAAAKGDQGAVAGVFNVALQVGDSVLGLAVLTAVAEGVDARFGEPGPAMSPVAYRSVYYSCLVLCAVALVLSLFAVRVPEAMRDTL